MKKALKLPTTINIGTGKESTRNAAFGYVGWGESTSKYLLSVTKSVKDADMEKIMTEAKEFSRASAHDLDESMAGGSIDVDDERANIAEGSATSDDSDEDGIMHYHPGSGAENEEM